MGDADGERDGVMCGRRRAEAGRVQKRRTAVGALNAGRAGASGRRQGRLGGRTDGCAVGVPPHWAPTLPLPFDRGDQEARPPQASQAGAGAPSSSPSHSPLGSLDVMRPLFLSLSLAGQRPWPCADGRPRPLFGACCCPLPAHAARGRPSSNCLRPMVGSCCYSIPCCFSLGRPPIIA